jgi:hypothetical protein
MGWADTVKSTALAVLAKRTATAGRISVDAPWSWNPHDVWLSRVNREVDTQSSSSDPTTRPRKGTALDD